MKFATYNIMFGMRGNSLLLNVLGHFAIHGVHSRNLTDYLSRYNKQAVQLALETNAEVISFNEVLGTLRNDEIINQFRKNDYNFFSWGAAGHYSQPLDIGTLIASKKEFERIPFYLPMANKMGGGAGACAIYLKDKNIVSLAVHFGLKEKIRVKQIEAVVDFLEKKKSEGRRIVLMGDFNSDEYTLNEDERFKRLGLKSANEIPTFQFMGIITPNKSIDNIFYGPRLRLKERGVSGGYSDHKLVWADLE